MNFVVRKFKMNYNEFDNDLNIMCEQVLGVPLAEHRANPRHFKSICIQNTTAFISQFEWIHKKYHFKKMQGKFINGLVHSKLGINFFEDIA